ncbi:putative T7SS-secreted protein [Blastococcus sp. LR1]|uniref:putative T7SS-secreted protein n=1 Tax=Blastococcus sp. LR1 TaxID=2877000 RepID=UPI001CCC58C0|nr:hypothetical protein [Blastococcus sp. LR1]MCA0144608.1 hypothetical protein [Blastococcus sp. LR1]
MGRPRDWSPVGWSTDPTPGDPDRVADLALRYRRTAEAVATASTNLGRIGNGTAYEGQGGDALRERTRDLSEQVGQLHDRYDAAADALEAYHPQQHAAQVTADAALSRARQALELQESAQGNLDRLENTPAVAGEPEDPTVTAGRNAAQRDLEHARSELQRAKNDVQRAHDDQHAAGNRAASSLQAAIDTDDLNDSWKDNALGVVKSIANVASAIAAIAGVLALLLSWVPILGQVLAAVALVATAVSLLCNGLLIMNGKDRWDQLKSDILGLALFGVGRLFGALAKTSSLATRSRAWQNARNVLAGTGNHASRRADAWTLIGGPMRAADRAHGTTSFAGHLAGGAREVARAPRQVVTEAISAVRNGRATWVDDFQQARSAFTGGQFWRNGVAPQLGVTADYRALSAVDDVLLNSGAARSTYLGARATTALTGATTLTGTVVDGFSASEALAPDPSMGTFDAPASGLPEGFVAPSSDIPPTPVAR